MKPPSATMATCIPPIQALAQKELQVPKVKDRGGYEAKRKRKWLPEWGQQYPFAKFDPAAKMMFCSTCRSFPAKAKDSSLFIGVSGDNDQEIIYVTYIENGLPVNVMLTMVTLQHANSQGILDAIMSGLHQAGLSEDDLQAKLVGFGCDGASVMIGHRNGVSARLKEMFGSLVTICVAHRLELTALDSMKSFPALTELKKSINGIYKHYHTSAKASRELKTVAEALNIHLVKPGTIDGTRWLPHTLHGLSALIRNYQAILFHLESHASDMHDREASDLMKGRASHTRDGLTLQMVSDVLQKTTLALVAMKTVPGQHLKQFLDEVGPFPGNMYSGVQLDRKQVDDDNLHKVKEKLCATEPSPAQEIGKDGTVWTVMEPCGGAGRRQIQNILTESAGPTPHARHNITDKLTAFMCLCDNVMLEEILDCTIAEAWRDRATWDVSIMELKAFIALLYVRGAYCGKNIEMESFWSEQWGNAFFNATLSRNRFWEIMRLGGVQELHEPGEHTEKGLHAPAGTRAAR
ncbi:hypothetical protein JOQ06_009536 [Pogonophryne albipinna]|uniref:PiggyBac transposable element-derived protein domain-containing protein n=1 Tax=Pogonophryne albipinna TaxID=1090488 RepID=A0AAD6BQQ8_9TELE|nr:hypothetical protein JOQ06_009536 [Pogonophryne albipinna]